MVLGQYLRSNPQRQCDPPQQLSTCCPGPAGNATLFMNRDKSHTVVTSGRNDFSLSLCLLDTLDQFLCLFRLARTSPRYKRTQGLGNFLENPLQFSSMLVRLQKRSQQGDFGTQQPINCNNSPGVFVNIAAWCNWHNCQVRARNKLGVLLARAGRVIKGTCFWRRSRGQRTRKHVGATARLIKWLLLISTMHMKGLCLLHDRFYASSPRDLPRYTRTEAGRKTMYHMYSLILTLSTDVCVCVYPCVYICAHLRKKCEWTWTHQTNPVLVCCG